MPRPHPARTPRRIRLRGLRRQSRVRPGRRRKDRGRLYTAVADKDAKKACNSISEKGQQEISEAAAQGGKKKRSCEQVFDVVLAFAGDQFAQAKDVKVTDVKLDGDQATAAIRVNDRDSQVTLLKEDGRWKLRGLSQSAKLSPEITRALARCSTAPGRHRPSAGRLRRNTGGRQEEEAQ